MIEQVFEISKQAPLRTKEDVMLILIQEVGELAQEVSIDSGYIKDKKKGIDGIIGEAIDVIQCALDVIWLTNPDITSETLNGIMNNKLNKWKSKFK